MAFEALVNTITLLSLVLFGLWILAHVAQAIELLVMRQAYRRHSPYVFSIPFVPLQTRLFHELAVPQHLAAEAIQRGDLPPAPRVQPLRATEDVQPSVSSATTTAKTLATPTPRSDSLPSSLPESNDSRLHRPPKKTHAVTRSRSGSGSRGEGAVDAAGDDDHPQRDRPIAVPVPLEAAALQTAAHREPAWWSPRLDGANLVLGLQLPLQLLPTEDSAALSKGAERLHSAAAAATASRGTSHGHVGRERVSPVAVAAAAAQPSRRQPTVSLQLKQFRLTSAAAASSSSASSLLPLTAALSDHAFARMSNVRVATQLQTAPPHHRLSSSQRHHAEAVERLQAAVAAQLAWLPMRIHALLRSPSAVPRASRYASSPSAAEFDAIKYAYIQHFQRLLEVAVAEQTALAHSGKQDRKSAKRAQRITAVLMQYLQYTHMDDDVDDEEDDDDLPLEDSIADEGQDISLNATRTEHGDSGVLETSASAPALAGPVRRIRSRVPWVPLLRDDPGSARRLSQSFSQRSLSTPTASATYDQRHAAGALKTKASLTPSPSTAESGSAVVVVAVPPLPPVHESRRSTRKRREAAAEIADTAVLALEGLVEQVRLAQALRPRYQSLLCAVNFRAERFIVRHGPAGPPRWAALHAAPPSASASSSRATKSASRQRTAEGGGRRSPNPRSPNSSQPPRGGGGLPRQLSAYGRTATPSAKGSGVYDVTQSDSISGASLTGELGHESSLASVPDGRAGSGGLRAWDRVPSPPSPDDATVAPPTRRALTTDFTEETAFAQDDDFKSPLLTPQGSAVMLGRGGGGGGDSSSSSSAAGGGQSMPGSTLLPPPSTRGGSNMATAGYATPLASTSANNAAMEFLQASRRARAGQRGGAAAHANGRASRGVSTAEMSQGGGSAERTDGDGGSTESWGSPLSRGRRRRTSLEPPTFNSSGPATRNNTSNNSGLVPSLRRNTSSLLSEGEALRDGAAAGAGSVAGEKLAVSTPPLDAVPAPPPPHRTDVRMAYIIGADRATLLRSLTLSATQTFATGTQNFHCFFTRKDEQRARRRYLEEADRQYRQELQQRLLLQRAWASRDVQQDVQSPGQAPLFGLVSDRSDDSDHRVHKPRHAAPSAATALTTADRAEGLATVALRHARTTSWHSVGLANSGVFTADSGSFAGVDGTALNRQETHSSLSQSLRSLHSFTVDGTEPSGGGAGRARSGTVVVVTAAPGSGAALGDPNAPTRNHSFTATPPPRSLSTSMYSLPDEQGLRAIAHRGESSLYGPEGAELVGTQGFETAQSPPPSSAISSASSSLATLPAQRERTFVGVATATSSHGEGGSNDTPSDGEGHGSGHGAHSKANRTPLLDEGLLQTLPSTDDAFAASLHSLHSVGDSVLATAAPVELADATKETEASQAPLQILEAEGAASAATPAGQPPVATDASVDAAQPTAAALVTSLTVAETGTMLENSSLDRRSKPSSNKGTPPPPEAVATKTRGKKGPKAAAAATAAVPHAVAETSTVAALPSFPATPKVQPQVSAELPDTIGDHDVRQYYGAIGVTLPEQVFLLRDARAKDGDALDATAGSTHSRRARNNSISKRRGKSAHNRSDSFASSTAAVNVAGSGRPGHDGRATAAHATARVLEGQVEVAELSLDVLVRQVGPFVPPSLPGMQLGADSRDDGEGDDDDAEGHHSSRRERAFTDSASESSDDYRDRRRARSGDRDRVLTPRDGGKRSQRSRGRDERLVRDTSSSAAVRSTRGSRHADGDRAREQRRRNRDVAVSRAQRRQQQRRLARWHRSIRKKQAAANKAAYSPVSVATLFFTGPPRLPSALLERLQAQQAADESAALPLPSWAVVDPNVPASFGVVSSHRGTGDFSASYPPRSDALQPAAHTQASICVTLIYTSTAEGLAQTLAAAAEVAAAKRKASRAAAALSANNSFTSFLELSFPRGGLGASVRDRHSDLRESSTFSSAISRRNTLGLDGNDSFPRGYSSIHTSAPTPEDSFHTVISPSRRESAAGALNHKVYSSPPAVDSRTATFAGDGDSVRSSSKDTTLPSREQREGHGPLASGAAVTGDSGGVVERNASGRESAAPLPPLLLLPDSSGNFNGYDGLPGQRGAQGGDLVRTGTSVFFDSRGAGGGGRFGLQDTICFDDDERPNPARDEDSKGQLRFAAGSEAPLGDQVTAAAEDLVSVLRDTDSFPAGVPVDVALTYMRIGNDLYAVTEVIDRTFLQYREERVIHPNAPTSGRHDGGDDDASSSVSSENSLVCEGGDDAEAKNSNGSFLNNTSFSSDTPFSTLDAALEAIQSQHELTARQQRRRMHHRRRAVSTMAFGNLSYSISGSAPLRPGTRRQEVHMCWRCLSEEAAVIFLPCGHYAVCEDCAEALADCCVCKTPILSSVVLLERPKPQSQPATSPKHSHRLSTRH